MILFLLSALLLGHSCSRPAEERISAEIEAMSASPYSFPLERMMALYNGEIGIGHPGDLDTVKPFTYLYYLGSEGCSCCRLKRAIRDMSVMS